ncbi:histone-like transcription factor (CBF/NF-Y) and archaeal histone domain-containing protein [Ditylenchus destructor]|uniref:Histone-like transcription factor (CBF/NF-Y) and archaeal histone domain-containing protein n=1 Tax=Ditylenchus destructor TaxID=166010 RepID=A0AAD4R9V4_9BILA|nr:histone-like transcription factor (CBF/NF-Y) and archaeal histone domain-containing protein [Ditylenchus destructor]
MEAEAFANEVEDSCLKTQLPQSRIRKICKMEPDLSSISSEAVTVITIGAEAFVKLLGKAAFDFTKTENRKTIQMKDIDRCIKKHWMFSILEDALDGWPDNSTKAPGNVPTNGAEIRDIEDA